MDASLRLRDLDARPLEVWRARAASRGGGSHEARVPLLEGRLEGLPEPLDGLLLTADLEARAPGDDGRLLGEVLAEELAGRPDLVPSRIGVVLAGDLFTVPGCSRRGGMGDVRDVWEAFAARFRWVVGVAGNHDLFGAPGDRGAFAGREGVHLLDGGAASLDGLVVGGVSGVVGAPRRGRPRRREVEAFAAALEAARAPGPHLLVLHEAPSLAGKYFPGSPEVAALLEGRGHPPVVCGHRHWRSPVGELAGGAAVWNVGGRVLLLRRG